MILSLVSDLLYEEGDEFLIIDNSGEVCNDASMDYYTTAWISCKVCGIPDYELYVAPEEFSDSFEPICESCMKWVMEDVISYTQNKILNACDGDMRYVYLLAETDEISKEMYS